MTGGNACVDVKEGRKRCLFKLKEFAIKSGRGKSQALAGTLDDWLVLRCEGHAGRVEKPFARTAQSSFSNRSGMRGVENLI